MTKDNVNDFDLRHQPIKGFYLTFQILSAILIRVPIWAIAYIPKSTRPRRSWSLSRTLWIKFAQHYTYISSRTGKFKTNADHRAIAPGLKGIWVDPIPTSLMNSSLTTWASIAGTEPIRLPGYWMDKAGLDTPLGAPPAPDEKVVYCLHGGSYTQLSANPRDLTAGIAKGLLQYIPSVKRTFSIEYRLAAAAPFPAENPFPTALLDALAGYIYLVRVVGFSPENIILEGDSAGGNLALALIRYLLEAHKDIPDLPGLPCGLILNSPWADVSPSHDTLESSSTKFKPYDYLMRPPAGSGHVYYPARALTGPHGLGAASTNPYISSASKHLPDVSFFGFPPTFITCGGIELLRDQIHTLRDRMVRDLGKESVSYHEAPDSVHDYLIFDFQEPERSQTLLAIADWAENL